MEGALSYNVIYADYFKGKKIRAEFLKKNGRLIHLPFKEFKPVISANLE